MVFHFNFKTEKLKVEDLKIEKILKIKMAIRDTDRMAVFVCIAVQGTQHVRW